MTETAEMQAKPVAWRWRERFPYDLSVDAAVLRGGRWSLTEKLPSWASGDDATSEFESLYSQSDFDAMRAQRDEARGIVRDIFWMALRYADGRMTYAVDVVNSAVKKAYDAGWITPKDTGGDPVTPRFARDGMFPEWTNIADRADAATAQVATLQAQITRLREALKPFAEYMSDGGDLDDKGCPLTDDQGPGWVYLTIADFRRARAALSEPSPSNSGDTPNV